MALIGRISGGGLDGMRLLTWLGTAAMALVFASSGARAQPIDTSYDFELRGGVLAHSVDEPGDDSTMGIFNMTRLQDANVELLFKSPDLDAFRWIGSPRPHVGATVNFDGLESMAYFGLTWRAQVFDTPLFVEGSFGGRLSMPSGMGHSIRRAASGAISCSTKAPASATL
jgi:hypothetical protein